MTRSRSTRTFKRPVALPLISACVLALAAGSCERADSNQKAMDAATIQLESLFSAGSNPVPSLPYREKAFNSVIAKLAPIADGSDPARAAAASVLVARAKQGLGEIASSDAEDLETQFRAQVMLARGQLDQWISQHSTAAALLTFDPTNDVAELDKKAGEKLAAAEKSRGEQKAQEQVVAGIKAKADKATASARVERDREAGIRKQAEGLSQTERESLIQKAVEASRAADGFDKQAADLMAEAAEQSPKVAEIANAVEQHEREAESLKKAKEGMLARAATAKTQAEMATKEADAAGGEIKKTLDGLDKIWAAAGTPTQEAIKQFTAAALGAKKGSTASSRDTKLSASVALGGYEQCLGDVQAAKARALGVYQSALRSIADAKPALPGAAEIGAKAAEVGKQFEDASKAAQTAYQDAIAAYTKAGESGAGDLKEKIDLAAKSVKELQDLRDKPIDEPKAPEAKPGADAKPAVVKPADAPAAELPPEQAKQVEDEIRAAMKEMGEAALAGDFDKLAPHFLARTDAEKQTVATMIPMLKASTELNAVCKEKFGKDFSALLAESSAPGVKGNPLFGMVVGPMVKGAAKAIASMDPATIGSETIKPLSLTEAEVTSPESPTPEKVMKEADGWKFSLGKALPSGPEAAAMLPLLKSMSGGIAEVAANAKAGKYASADDMLTQLSAKVMGAMGGLGGPKPKPGGGGGKDGSGGGGGG